MYKNVYHSFRCISRGIAIFKDQSCISYEYFVSLLKFYLNFKNLPSCDFHQKIYISYFRGFFPFAWHLLFLYELRNLKQKFPRWIHAAIFSTPHLLKGLYWFFMNTDIIFVLWNVLLKNTKALSHRLILGRQRG